ncbi:MAG: sigma factor [Anaerolineae bacterium]|nr:sigma factor [Anaerolineae bacterium]
MDERALVAAARKGSVASFNELVRLHQDLAYSLACRLLGCPEAAAKATQEAFLSAYRALPAFDGGSFRSWLLRLVIECCRRGTARAPANPANGLEEGLAALPWEERVALVLADVAGLGHHQIAAATGARPQQVRRRLHRGRSWLRDWLVTQHGLPERQPPLR